ncbi:hypothetical protein [Amycolatopsis japonica]|nr:hypothetical protein [Amycolatopsis japonica]
MQVEPYVAINRLRMTAIGPVPVVLKGGDSSSMASKGTEQRR